MAVSANSHSENSASHQRTSAGRVARLKGIELKPSDDPLLEYLTPTQLEILRAHGSYDEIAATLNIPIGTVRSRLSRARAALVQLRKEASDAHDGAVDAPFPFS
jgi:DNA-directed RNA polymerase specialized sigma24 family protein